MKGRPHQRGGQAPLHHPLLRGLVAATLWLALAPGVGVAADERLDAYDPAEHAWFGLSRLAAVAEAEGVHLTRLSRVVLSAQDRTPLLALSANPGDVKEALGLWVQSGGRIVWADDREEGDLWWQALGLRPRVPQGGGEGVWQQDPALLLAEPVGEHPLSPEGLWLLTNHPVALVGPGVPLYRLSDEEGLVFDFLWGRGWVLALGDPSLFINEMLRWPGNDAWTRLVLRRLCEGRETCVVGLVGPDTAWEVEAGLWGEGRAPPQGLRGALASLPWWPPRAFPDHVARALGLLVLLGNLILWAVVWLWWTPTWWRRAAQLPPPVGPSRWARRARLYQGPLRERDWRDPAEGIRRAWERWWSQWVGAEGAASQAAWRTRCRARGASPWTAWLVARDISAVAAQVDAWEDDAHAPVPPVQVRRTLRRMRRVLPWFPLGE